MHWIHSYFAGLLPLVAAAPTTEKYENSTTMVKSWSDVPVSADLQYTPCFGNFSCAYLQVPLDYEDASAGTADIAFLKYSSPVQPAMGDLILNPGGPGESGVQFLEAALDQLLDMFGTSFNLVGMDPRSVNNSGPSTNCFPDEPNAEIIYGQQLFDVEPLSEQSLRNYYQASGGFGTWCSQMLNDTAKYVNTPATAQDMLQYTEKLATSEGKDPNTVLVNYYGVSYGSTLGTTFAAMYPDRVGRFIIDGVVDVDDYYYGNWSQNILQANEAMEAFFDLCAKAGPNCALNGNETTTGAQIQTRVDNVIQNLTNNPISVADIWNVEFPTTVNHVHLALYMLEANYNAWQGYTGLAETIALLEKGNGSALARFAGRGELSLLPPNESAPYDATFPKLIIACNDNNHHFQGTYENFIDLLHFDEGISSYVGAVWWAIIIPQCRNLKFTPVPNQQFGGFKKTKTSTPILFTDNKIDIVASSYYKMSAYFEGSTVMLVDSIAHGLTNTQSGCINQHLQAYLANLTMPANSTLCPADVHPFTPLA